MFSRLFWIFLVIASEIRKEAFRLSVSAFFFPRLHFIYAPLSMSVFFKIWPSDTTVGALNEEKKRDLK